MMKNNLFIFFISIIFFASCEKEDTAIVLPSPGSLEHQSVSLGSNFEYQAYVSLGNNSIVTRDYMHAYDLAFEASSQGTRVYLNNARMMFACNTGSLDISVADSSGKHWRFDQEKLNPDSTAIGNWWIAAATQNNISNVFYIDRGAQILGNDRYKKFQILSVTNLKYRVRFSNCDNNGVVEIDVPKDTTYSLMYLSFDNGGKVVQVAPPKDQWDFVFTRYTHEYFEYPESSPYRHYTVTGALLNVWNDVQGCKNKLDSTPNYVAFDSCNANYMNQYLFSKQADIIGYDWKYYVINDNHYYLTPNLYFIIQDKNGFYYKLRILDYYDPQGNRGTVTFQYQRM